MISPRSPTTSNPPEGYRVEIIERDLVVSPSPAGRHIRCASRMQYALRALLPVESEIAQTASLVIPHSGERYVPDLAVLPEKLLDERIWRRGGFSRAWVEPVPRAHRCRPVYCVEIAESGAAISTQ